MPKLHELLAVEQSLKGQAEHARTQIISETFGKKVHHFSEKRVTFFSNDDSVPQVEEQRDIQTSVKSELAWLREFVIKGIDAGHQVAVANRSASADIVLENGDVIAKDVPATSLLELEKRIKDMQAVCHAIPTLDPVKGFTLDPDRGDGVYKARDVNTKRTKRTKKAFTLAPPTDKHPAQVQMIEEDDVIGRIQTQEWSGLITPNEKSVLLNRCEELLRAIKKARSRANDFDADVLQVKIGSKLLSYIFG